MPHIADFERLAFIVGAPRCGTTTMSKMLRSHPEIAVPFVKEPHFFSQNDLRGLTDAELREHVEQDYLGRFFGPKDPAERVAADGSVSYLYLPEQLEPVLRLWPESRFIIGVRDPLTLLPSLHKRLIFVGDETLRSFEEAWAATPDRAAGRRIPRSCIEPRFLRYDEAGRFGTYVERLFAAVGRERCLVVVFDDLIADPEGEYRRIMRFIGLDPVESIDLGVERESRAVRHAWLQRLLKRPPKALHPMIAGREYRKRFNGGINGKKEGSAVNKILSLRKRILLWNEVEDNTVVPVPLHVQQQIRSHFRDEIERLGLLIGRDLDHWLQPEER
jgi:hypothetical protein